MDRYVISSITETPNPTCQWELVTQEGDILLLTYGTGELTLCRWVSTPNVAGEDGKWEEVARRQGDSGSVLERIRDCHISLDDAIAMLGDLVAVTSYVASYELQNPAAYERISSSQVS